MIKKFSEFVTEAKGDVTIVFGRFNPPTSGHEKLFETLKKVSKGGMYRIYASKSEDSRKNPLPFRDKVKFLRKMFPKHARNIMADTDTRTVIDVARKLYDQGFTKMTMVAGSDRVKEFEILLNKYNGVEARHGFYQFEGKIKVISAGERDPDSDDVSGMSASKLRVAAADNDLELFSKGMPKSYKDSKELFNAVRKGMGLKETKSFRKHVELPKVSDRREDYIEGNLFTEGDTVQVKESKEVGQITTCGANYLTIKFENKSRKVWLDQVELVEKSCGSRKKKVNEDDPCWDTHVQKGMKKKGKKMVPNCVPKEAKSKDYKSMTAKQKAAHDKPRSGSPESKHTKNFKKMYGENTLTFEEFNIIEKADVTDALKKKADKSGMPYAILKKVFDRGYAAWSSSHRPGTNPTQWGLARVNSFATKSKGTWGKADADLAKKVRGE